MRLVAPAELKTTVHEYHGATGRAFGIDMARFKVAFGFYLLSPRLPCVCVCIFSLSLSLSLSL